MVKHWFNCKVSSRSLDSEGAEVKKVEQFVLDAYTYTEAETRMTQICEHEGIRPFEITQLTKTNLVEVIRHPECDKWFRVKVAMTSFDADRGTEKESNQHVLVSATDVRDAFDKVAQHMNQLGVGYMSSRPSPTKRLSRSFHKKSGKWSMVKNSSKGKAHSSPTWPKRPLHHAIQDQALSYAWCSWACSRSQPR